MRFLLCCLWLVCWQVQAQFLSPATTPYSRALLKATNASAAVRQLSITNTFGTSNTWHWFASVSREGLAPDDGFVWLQSNDGLIWTTNSAVTLWKEPDYKSNNWAGINVATGPWNRDAAFMYRKGKFYCQYNYDPFNVGHWAQGIGIASSADGTNWHRITVLYPFGTTNTTGQMFAGTWFDDPVSGSNHILFSYTTNGITKFDGYIIRQLDETYTNWTAPVMILSNGLPYGMDGQLVWNSSSNRYDCYYQGTMLDVATNKNLSSLFEFSHSITPFVGAGGIESPKIFKLTANTWRCVAWVDGVIMYGTSTTAGTTWGTFINLTNGGWWGGTSGQAYYGYSPGMVWITNNAAVTNQVTVIGDGQDTISLEAAETRVAYLKAKDLEVTSHLGVNGNANVSGNLAAVSANFNDLHAADFVDFVMMSNTLPNLGVRFANLGDGGCVFWNSNGTLLLICTNAISGTCYTNKLGGL